MGCAVFADVAFVAVEGVSALGALADAFLGERGGLVDGFAEGFEGVEESLEVGGVGGSAVVDDVGDEVACWV